MPELALTALNQALQLRPNFPEASLEKGKLLERMGEYESSATKASTQPALSATMQRYSRPNCISCRQFSEAVEQAEKLMARTDDKYVPEKQLLFRESTGQTQKVRPSHGRMEEGIQLQTNFDPVVNFTS